jgi:hypothetical protein
MHNDAHVTLTPDLLAGIVQRDAIVLRAFSSLADNYRQLAFTLHTTADNPEAVALTYIQVIVALATLQSSVQDLSRAYINHANTVLNPGRSGGLDVGLSNILADSGLLTTGRIADGLPQVEEPVVEGKKKRKRAKHDPNAPKRALTPYFLYMQSARSQIAKELGEHAKPKEVADEGTRRWGSMSPGEKAVSVDALCDCSSTNNTTGLGRSLRKQPRCLPREDGRLQSWSTYPR